MPRAGGGGGRGWTQGPARPAVPFDLQCKARGLEAPIPEFRFAVEATKSAAHPKGRQWRFDWSWPEHRLALEVEGGYAIQARCRCGEPATCKKCNRPIAGGGRHNRAEGFLEDMNKYNTAAILGWRLLKVPPKAIADGTAIAVVQQFFSKETDRGLAGLDDLAGGGLFSGFRPAGPGKFTIR